MTDLDTQKARELAQSAIERHEFEKAQDRQGFDGCGAHDGWEDWPCETIQLTTVLLQALDELATSKHLAARWETASETWEATAKKRINELEIEVNNLKTVSGWHTYMEQQTKPLRDEIARLTELVERKDD